MNVTNSRKTELKLLSRRQITHKENQVSFIYTKVIQYAHYDRDFFC